MLSSPHRWHSCGVTDKGSVRPINEDAILTLDDKYMWAVADGLGGHQIGKVASQKIITGLATTLLKSRLDECVETVEDKLIDLNNQLLHYSKAHIQGKKMGSTIVCLVIKENVGICFWVGDSRLYRRRDKTLKQMTRDHSFVEELIKRGMITREEAKVHPERHIITQAVGTDPEMRVEICIFGVRPGDTYLLCSDGLYDTLNQNILAKGLAFDDIQHGVDFLINKSLDIGALDNVSVILVRS